jgi:Replication-relaxation
MRNNAHMETNEAGLARFMSNPPEEAIETLLNSIANFFNNEITMEPPKITPKQLEILILLYKYRFLNRKQIQQFLNHKDPKRINAWLKDLTEKNITGRKYSYKIGENIKPAIYCLSTKSIRILKGRKDINDKILNRVYRDRKRSDRLITHSTLLADIYFFLKLQAVKGRQILQLFTKTDLSNHNYLPYERPDAYISLEDSQGNIKRYFLEIIDEGTPH